MDRLINNLYRNGKISKDEYYLLRKCGKLVDEAWDGCDAHSTGIFVENHDIIALVGLGFRIGCNDPITMKSDRLMEDFIKKAIARDRNIY